MKNKKAIIAGVIIILCAAWGIDKMLGYRKSSSSTTSGSMTGHRCLQCNKEYSGNGWMTAGGEQYQPSRDNGDQYCSRACAYESQPSKWKR